MMLANRLMGGTPDGAAGSVRFDLMRLPLGVLSGMGFIGGGAILRRGDLVMGLTTAASLWLATMVGICLGAGQLVLGCAGTAVGLVGLWGLHPIERFLVRERQGTLTVEHGDAASTAKILERAEAAGFRIKARSVLRQSVAPSHTLRLVLAYRAAERDDVRPEALVDDLVALPGVSRTQWMDGSLDEPR
jgi:putative Mg2+ transporter-C (MgtC) family protein